MSEIEAGLVCPKCGAPRLQHAWDCSQCGTVFDRGEPSTEAQSADPPSATAVKRRDLVSGGMRVQRPTGVAAFRAWIDANVWVAVFLALVLFAGTLWAFARVVANTTDQPESVEGAYRRIVGGFPPRGFEPSFAGHFVGRHLVVLEHGDGLELYLYTQRWPARPLDEARVDSTFEGVFEFLEMEWAEVQRGTVPQGGGTITVRVLQLVEAQGLHVYLFPIRRSHGERAMLVLYGPQKEAREMAKEIVERF